MSYLQKILEVCQTRLDTKMRDLPQDELINKIFNKSSNIIPIPIPINIYTHLYKKKGSNIIAEYKRASPSEGIISNVRCEEQVMKYLAGGVVGISILTDPDHFNGNLSDLTKVRQSLIYWNAKNKEKVFLLRKDFIFSEYQILESRLYGADSILLIVAVFKILFPMLDISSKLEEMICVSRDNLMEPLVEINNLYELQLVLKTSAKVIGLNCRDLHSFTLDMGLVEKLTPLIPDDKVVIILSGLKTQDDIQYYRDLGLKHYLIGTSLMKTENPTRHIRHLTKKPPLIKICGLQDANLVDKLVKLNVDLIGLVFADSKRRVTMEKAKEIVSSIRAGQRYINHNNLKINMRGILDKKEYFSHIVEDVKVPLLVGVFQDQSLEEVNTITEALDLDLIQLHGSEVFSHRYCRPIIKVHSYTPECQVVVPSEHFTRDDFAFTLFDTKVGNSSGGQALPFNHKLLSEYATKLPYILAGGLTPENIRDTIDKTTPWMVDVSSGVEVDGVKDLTLIEKFVDNVNNVNKNNGNHNNNTNSVL